MIAKTVSFTFVPGEYRKTQGHKGYERPHYKNGCYINPTGHGWGTESKPSKIIVGVSVDGTYTEIWVDHYFKSMWGKLTAGRVEAIRATLPEELDVIMNETSFGSIYYTADEACLEKWLSAAMIW